MTPSPAPLAAVDAAGATDAATKPIWLGTSWKMTKSLAEARAYAGVLAAADAAGAVSPDVRLFVLPAHTTLAAVHDVLAGTEVLVGAQNAHWADDGPVTGEVSMGMVRDAGAALVEIGHADRRTWFGETDESVAAKVVAAVRAGLVPLVCVGEPHPVGTFRASGLVGAQVRKALATLPAGVGRVLVAYEPHWAIGDRGVAASPDHVSTVVASVRRAIDDLDHPPSTPTVLYGGGVTERSAAALLASGVDGLFVGRAASSADGLLRLAARCSRPDEDDATAARPAAARKELA